MGDVYGKTNTYQCTLCFKSFKTFQGWTRHMLFTHGRRER